MRLCADTERAIPLILTGCLVAPLGLLWKVGAESKNITLRNIVFNKERADFVITVEANCNSLILGS